MRIAQIAPLYEDVPPATYGGTERVVAGLCDGLVAAGHDVTLFATATSTTTARLEPAVHSPLRSRMGAAELAEHGPRLHEQMLDEVLLRADEFDVIHSHVDLSLPYMSAVGSPYTPWLLTMHGRLDVAHARIALSRARGAALVSISDDQRRAVASLPLQWMATVPNGLALGDYHRHPRDDGGYLAFLGRMSHEKRPDVAIEVARRTGWQLKIAAKVDPFDTEYFRHEIEPLLAGDHVEFLGELGEAEKPGFFATAAATLFPSDWPEPFGLVMIESLAAGTPVIALRRGSVPEILEHGVSGFICDDPEDMVRAVDRIGEIDPADCRRRARDFGVEQMADGYERVYAELMARASAGATDARSA